MAKNRYRSDHLLFFKLAFKRALNSCWGERSILCYVWAA